MMPIRIAGAGCALMDRLFVGVDFAGDAFRRYRSMADGDGGLAPGKLVFVSDVEGFACRTFDTILENLVPGSCATAENIGGPSIVAMIHAAQMLPQPEFQVSFHGLRGDDETGERLAALLGNLPLDCAAYGIAPGPTPSTFVFSDPAWDGGHGERCFVNDIGVAAGYTKQRLLEPRPDEKPAPDGSDFLDADIVAFGGTGLVPALHDSLGEVLPEAHARGCLTVVNTVFDFRNERRDPCGPWPLGRPGDSAKSFAACDLLIMDRDEAFRLSGTKSLDAAALFFMASGVSAFVITQGSGDVIVWAADPGIHDVSHVPATGRFDSLPLCRMPVSERAGRELREGPKPRGDTTGCGDAFAGGIIAALARQMNAQQIRDRRSRDRQSHEEKSHAEESRGARDGGPCGGQNARLDLADAVTWGIAAGAVTLGIVGGTWYEKVPGEKCALVESYRNDYLCQISRAGVAADRAGGKVPGPVPIPVPGPSGPEDDDES